MSDSSGLLRDEGGQLKRGLKHHMEFTYAKILFVVYVKFKPNREQRVYLLHLVIPRRVRRKQRLRRGRSSAHRLQGPLVLAPSLHRPPPTMLFFFVCLPDHGCVLRRKCHSEKQGPCPAGLPLDLQSPERCLMDGTPALTTRGKVSGCVLSAARTSAHAREGSAAPSAERREGDWKKCRKPPPFLLWANNKQMHCLNFLIQG